MVVVCRVVTAGAVIGEEIELQRREWREETWCGLPDTWTIFFFR